MATRSPGSEPRSPSGKLDDLILDMLDTVYPVSRASVLRAKSERGDVDLIRARLDVLVESGQVILVKGDRLLRSR